MAVTPKVDVKDFVCQRCNKCCEQPGYVYLEEGDPERIAKALQMDVYEFTKDYCKIIDRKDLVLNQKVNGPCMFLTPQGCEIYQARPKQCREFPFTWHTKESFDYCEGMKLLVKNSKAAKK